MVEFPVGIQLRTEERDENQHRKDILSDSNDSANRERPNNHCLQQKQCQQF